MIEEKDIVKVNDIVKLPIESILVNPENPRHNPVFGLDEFIVMQQLINSPGDAKAMYKLMTDIYKNGWFAQSVITVTYDSNREKYVAWDGNRRLTSMKILQNPELSHKLKYFSYQQVKTIFEMSKVIKDQSFYEVSCYVATTFNECSDYIRTIHTTDTGALPWNTVAIKRFEDKLGIKNIFSQLEGYCPKAFSDIGNNFPVGKFEKIAKTKVGKEYLGIQFEDNVLTCLTSLSDLDEKVSRIINDIKKNNIKSDMLKSTKKIQEYLYPNTLVDTESKELNSLQQTINNNISEENISNEKQTSIFNNGDNNMNQYSHNVEEPNLNIKLKSEDKQGDLNSKDNISEVQEGTNNLNIPIMQIKKEKDIILKNIDISKLDYSNERARGIWSISYEIQNLSISNLYLKYPIAYTFLVRSLLEQSSIYFLTNKNIWNKLVSSNNNKDLRLEQIIVYISKNTSNIFDDTTKSAWETCFDTLGNKKYLDLVIHHPYKINANTDAIKNILDIGLFAIIQYFINNK